MSRGFNPWPIFDPRGRDQADEEEPEPYVAKRVTCNRCREGGKERVVTIYPIIARDTVDELVMARRETKREVQDLLLEAMKARLT